MYVGSQLASSIIDTVSIGKIRNLKQFISFSPEACRKPQAPLVDDISSLEINGPHNSGNSDKSDDFDNSDGSLAPDNSATTYIFL